jgi:hypothetical protein
MAHRHSGAALPGRRLAFTGSRIRSYVGTLLFVGFILAFHYLSFHRSDSTWKIALEAWVMIGFITWALIHTGNLESPLVSLYLLVVVTTALTLGKNATLQIALIAACYLWLGDAARSTSLGLYLASLAAQLAPMVLVAYINGKLMSGK